MLCDLHNFILLILVSQIKCPMADNCACKLRHRQNSCALLLNLKPEFAAPRASQAMPVEDGASLQSGRSLAGLLRNPLFPGVSQ
jgi:hypothetical protein